MRTLILVFFLTAALFAQNGRIQGRVYNMQNNAPLSDANVSIIGAETGATTNQNGSFTISNIPAGDVRLLVQYIGFAKKRTTVHVQANETNRITIGLNPTAITLGQIVVTSMKYKQTLRTTPMPLSVVSSRRIAATMPRDASEAVAMEPGLTVTRDGVWGTNVNIRGLSRNSIVMMVDGIRIDTANDLAAGLSMIDANDIDRVEVIKGAASSLYGAGAVGGVVNVMTKEGAYSDKLSIHGSMTTGASSVNSSSQGSMQLNASGSTWFVKASGMMRDAQDAKTPTGTLHNSRYNDDNIAARLGFRPFANHEFRLNWQRYRGRDIGIPGGNPLFPGQADVRYPKENRDLFSVKYIGRNITPSLSRITINLFRQDILRDVENIPHLTKTLPGTPEKRMNVLQILPSATHKMIGAQAQTDWIVAGQHIITGVDLWQKDMDSFRERVLRIDVLQPDGSTAKSINQIIGERPIPLSSYQSIGAFAQDELSLLRDKLTMIVGGRYDKITVNNEKTLQPVYTAVDGVVNETPDNQIVMWDATNAGDHSWSGNMSLLYKVTPRLDVTFNTARSFRSPYLEERFQYIDLGNLLKIGDPHLQPEQGYFNDAGVRLWHERWTLVGNIFMNKIKDMVVEVPALVDGRNALQKTNIGSAVLYGFDLSGDVKLSRLLNISASAAYVYGQDSFKNEPLPLVPPLNGRVSLHGALNRFFTYELAAALFYTQNRTAGWEIETPGYVRFDAYLTSKPFFLGGIQNQFFFGVENVADRAYRDHLSTNRGFITVEPGRNFSIRWRLGI